MRTEAELDAIHNAVVARFPDGVNGRQFALVTLESADEDGRVYPHSAGDQFARHSLMMSMWLLEGLVEPGSRGYHEPIWWKITDKGREWLATQSV